MTIEQMNTKLKEMGLNKKYRPRWDHESEAIFLNTRKPVEIKDGLLKGSQIDIYDNSTIRVLTGQKKKAMDYAKRYNLQAYPMDFEAELLIPVTVADEVLPKFGAKTKRVLSEKQLAVLKRLGKLR